MYIQLSRQAGEVSGRSRRPNVGAGMFCHMCGTSIGVSARFCTTCGAKILAIQRAEATLPYTGRQVPDGIVPGNSIAFGRRAPGARGWHAGLTVGRALTMIGCLSVLLSFRSSWIYSESGRKSGLDISLQGHAFYALFLVPVLALVVLLLAIRNLRFSVYESFDDLFWQWLLTMVGGIAVIVFLIEYEIGIRVDRGLGFFFYFPVDTGVYSTIVGYISAFIGTVLDLRRGAMGAVHPSELDPDMDPRLLVKAKSRSRGQSRH